VLGWGLFELVLVRGYTLDRCDPLCVSWEPEFLPGEAVTVSTVTGELAGVIEARLEDGVYAVQVEGEFPRLVIGGWALRRAADAPVIVPAG
jgi:hypothetical protein